MKNSKTKYFNRWKWLGLVVLLIAAVFWYGDFGFFSGRSFFAGFMPVETITTEDLKSAYADHNFKILLVPGHDNVDYGTKFNGVREADLTLALAKELNSIFKDDERFKVFNVRNLATGDYDPVFSEYFTKESKDISSFRTRLKETLNKVLQTGGFKVREGVDHNFVPNRVVQKLYGLNKWANENNIDVVLHMHFNDDAERRAGRAGDYEGFTIYVPEEQFSSSRTSRALAQSIFDRLKRNFSISTIKGESAGIVEDQKLIAVGAKGSLDSVGLLIEYGYIYEPQFLDAKLRQAVMRELAYQTFVGIKQYFEPSLKFEDTTLLPHIWETSLKRGIRGNRDVLAMQAALLKEGLYPPSGKSLADCSLTGSFGPCTEAAISSFQEKYAGEILAPFGLSRGTGSAGPTTITKLNKLYGVRPQD